MLESYTVIEGRPGVEAVTGPNFANGGRVSEQNGLVAPAFGGPDYFGAHVRAIEKVILARHPRQDSH